MTTVTLDDVRTTLEGQHSQVKQMIQAVKDSSGDTRQEAFTQLCRTLAAHEAAEEEVVHATANKELGGHAEVVDERVSEEKEAGSAITDLEGMDVDSDDFAAAFAELADAVVEHAEAEEHEELPKLDGVVDDDELTRMKKALDRVPELATDDGAGTTFMERLESARAQFRQTA